MKKKFRLSAYSQTSVFKEIFGEERLKGGYFPQSEVTEETQKEVFIFDCKKRESVISRKERLQEMIVKKQNQIREMRERVEESKK